MAKNRKIAVFLLEKYQKFISPLYPPCCKFHPTCSKYAIEAIKHHGLIKGFILASYRIIRCNPASKGGLDYIPKKHNKQ